MISLQACAVALRSGIFSRLSINLPRNNIGPTAQFHNRMFSSSILPSQVTSTTVTTATLPTLVSYSISGVSSGCNSLLVNPCRTIMKNFWPRPRENKRLRNHGWKTRMSTPAGRRIIMRRILRGRHVLTH